MDFRTLFISFEGRISRRQFWIGLAILVVASIALTVIVQTVVGIEPIGGQFAGPHEAMAAMRTACWANLFAFVIIAWPALAIMLKRRHDRGSSGVDVWVYFGLAIVVQLIPALGIGYQPVLDPDTGRYTVIPSTFANIIGALFGLLALYLLVVMGFLKGDPASNVYGLSP